MKSIFIKLSLVGCTLICLQAKATTAEQATLEVQQLLASSETSVSKSYCKVTPWECRTVVYLKDKVTGLAKNAFWTVFYAPDRRVGAVDYYIGSSVAAAFSGEYVHYNYPALDAQIKVSEVLPSVTVAGSETNITQISNIILPVLGSNPLKYGHNTISFDANNEMIIDGVVTEGLDGAVVSQTHKEFKLQN